MDELGQWTRIEHQGADLLPTELGSVSSATAALLGCVNGSWFAVTFGQGRNLLRPQAITKSFGLRVTLNAVAEGSLRSIDKETFDAVANHSRQQASRETDSAEFGLDVERDLVHAVTGTPRDPALGERFSGTDALSVTAQLEIKNLESFLTSLQLLHGDDTYRRTFLPAHPAHRRPHTDRVLRSSGSRWRDRTREALLRLQAAESPVRSGSCRRRTAARGSSF